MGLSAVGRLVSLLERITYKPGWRFEVSSSYGSTGSPDAISLYAYHRQPDANRSGEMVQLVCPTSWTEDELSDLTDAQLVDRIRRLIIEAEMHEVEEWLKFDGICVVDPHPPRFRILPEMRYHPDELLKPGEIPRIFGG
jgi:hypothetical protein